MITLNKDTANLYKAFNIDKTPVPTYGVTNNAIQTWPPSQGTLANTGWGTYYNNVATPWVDMSGVAMSTISITWNDATLYLRNVQPKYSIYAKIMEDHVPPMISQYSIMQLLQWDHILD